MSVIYNYNGMMALEARFLWEAGIMKECTYKQNVRRGRISVLHRSAPGSPAVISYDKLPLNIRKAIDSKLLQLGEAKGSVKGDVVRVSFFESQIKADPAAMEFFTNYKVDGERKLKYDVIDEYYNNAIVMNAMHDALTLRQGQRNACALTGNKKVGLFTSVFQEVQKLDKDLYPHTLPNSERRLREKYNRYINGGTVDYASLIHSNYCNQNSRKVNEDLEHLIISLYCQKNNPYSDWVCDQYLQFLAGNIEVVDTRTGELFDRNTFCNENGDPIIISKATVWNIVNNPANKVLIDSIRLSFHKFGANVRPHVHRMNAKYSLSKVSLDDRDLPRKLHNGNRVKAYYAYDVCSGALIGAAYSLKKDTNLFIDCLRDMFRNLDRMNTGLPLEMEVENHLVRQYEDDLMAAGNLFPFVRWCAPTNSQEKHAEQFNRAKKYGYEKRYQDGIGRWYLKLNTNQTEGERFYNEQTDRYEIKEKTYDYERLVADDRDSIVAYNNGLHRDQKSYPGKTRMEVFMENLNPQLTAINRALLLKYIGNCTTTSIQRNQYVQVQYADYQLSNLEVLRRLKPNNYTVQTYYLADSTGVINEVYMYQDGEYLGTAQRIEAFTTAAAEWTDKDTAAMTEQLKYISHFDKVVKEKKSNVAAVKIYPKTNLDDLQLEVVNIPDPVSATPQEDNIDDLIKKYSAVSYKEYSVEIV